MNPHRHKSRDPELIQEQLFPRDDLKNAKFYLEALK